LRYWFKQKSEIFDFYMFWQNIMLRKPNKRLRQTYVICFLNANEKDKKSRKEKFERCGGWNSIWGCCQLFLQINVYKKYHPAILPDY
jgi:hypothetical protein